MMKNVKGDGREERKGKEEAIMSRCEERAAEGKEQ